jgi:hypothetical protein
MRVLVVQSKKHGTGVGPDNANVITGFQPEPSANVRHIDEGTIIDKPVETAFA